MAKRPAARSAVRDYLSMALGTFLFVYQAVTWHLSAELMGSALVLVLGPAAIGLFQLARGSDETPDIPEPKSPSRSRSRQQR